MGRCVEILLVRLAAPLLAPCLLALFIASSAPAFAQTVDAQDYDAFWLWAGVAPQPLLARAHTLYILQGQVEAHTLRWTPAIHAQMLARIDRWRAAGTPIAGVQIDFDARTRHLDEYGAFLRDLSPRLPRGLKLSVTGLLDWTAGRDPAGLNALGGVVDEVVIQTYQGRRTIPGYGAYLASLTRLRFPFKIGLIQGGEWSPPPDLAANPWFRGYVVFLKNGDRGRPAIAAPPSTTEPPRP